MKNRTFFFTLLFASLSYGLFAQQEKPLHYYQVGIQFSSLNSFGLNFKTGNEKTLVRMTLLSLNMGQNSSEGRLQDSIDMKNSVYGAGFRVGFEKHVPVFTHVNFIWGLEAGFNYNYQKQEQDMSGVNNDYERSAWSVTPALYLILGATYTLSDHLVIGAEITPGVQYSYGKTKIIINMITTEQTNSGFNFSFSNNSASLSLAYRFGK